MNCFDEIVGLREIDSNCLYWVNDLTGITTELAIDLQTTDNEFLSDFWNMIKTRSYIKILSDFKISFYKYFSVYCKDITDINTYLPNLLCQYKNIFDISFLNLVALELLKEKIYSSNINFFTTHNIENTKELSLYYQKEYQRIFDDSFKAVQVPSEITHKNNYPNSIIVSNFQIP